MAPTSPRAPGAHRAPRAPRAGRSVPTRRGFTLVEVLVALLIMAGLAALAWRGLDSIVRARDGSNQVMDATLRLNTIVTQWEQDLLAVQDTGAVPPISFDGQSLRLTRRAEGGISLVVWALRGGSWQRWAAPVVTRSNELGEYWLRSQQLLGNEAGQLTVAEATDWQVFFYRGNAWTNAQSTGDLQQARQAEQDVAVATPAPVQPSDGAASEAKTDAGAQPGSLPGGRTQADLNAQLAAQIAAAQQQREQMPDAVRLVIRMPAGTLTRDIALGPGGT